MKYIRSKLIFTLFILIPTVLFAGGFASDDVSPRLQGQAMAGSGADAGDITAIFSNPAILSTINKPEVYVGASYNAPHLSMNNATAEHGEFSSSIPALLQPVTGSDSQSNIGVARTMPSFYAAMPLNHGFTYGMSFTSPWSYQSRYAADSAVRYMAQDTDITSYSLEGMLSFAVNNQLSFAAGIQGQYLAANITNFEGVSSEFAPTTQASSVNANNMGLGYVLGALYSATDNTHVGISYRSKINYQLHGNANQYLNAGPQSSADTCTSTTSGAVNNCYSAAEIDLTTPSVLNMSLVQQVTPQWQLDFTTEVTFWSQFSGIDMKTPDASMDDKNIENNWQNSALFSVGTNYQLDTHWTLRTGLGYDQTPSTQNARDARIPDSNKILTAFGATYQMNSHFIIDASYEHAFMESQNLDSNTTDGQRRAFPDSIIPIPTVSPYQENQVTADYSGSADIIAFGINYLF